MRNQAATSLGYRAQNGKANLEGLLVQGLATWHGGKPEGARIVLHAHAKPVSDLVLEDRK